MLREVADLTGLSSQVTAALADTYQGPWTHAPGDVFADLAAAVADGADCVDGVGQLWGDREHVFGEVASTTTLWRLVDERIDAVHLPRIRAARAHARQQAWAAGAAPDRNGWLHLDVDATITVDYSDNKENAAATWKKTFGFHPLLVFLDRPDIAAGEALAGLLRKGNAGSNTTDDHISVLGQALASLPPQYRPDADNPNAPKVLIRSDSAGATYGFAAACRTSGVGFSLGTAIDAPIRDAVEMLNTADGWYPAIDSGGGIRDGAWVAEATELVDLSKWPAGTRLILRKERPHPGAQLTFTDSDGHRVTGFLTDTPDGVVPGQLAGLELRHRQHARVEDRIRSSSPASWPGTTPSGVSVRNPVMRCPSESVNVSCAPGCGRSLRRINRVPAGHFDKSTSSVASATQAPSRMPPPDSIAGYQPSAVLSISTASRIGASIAVPRENPTPDVRQAAAKP